MRAWRVLAAVALAASACAGSGAAESPELVVFAASSLTDAFTEIARADGSAPTFSFAGSQQLARQIVQGAPADVFAAADDAYLQAVVDAAEPAGTPQPFAANRLAIAVERGNPLGIAGLADLAASGVKTVLAAPQVPAGRYAAEALGKAGVELQPVSLEADVRAVLAKVRLGEADAGIVYASDVAAAADDVDGVAIPDQHNVAVTYPIVAVTAEGQAFVDLVLSDTGREVLARHGFDTP